MKKHINNRNTVMSQHSPLPKSQTLYFLQRHAIMAATILMLLFTIRPATAQNPFAGGDGTEANPFQITTEAQLDSIRKDYLDDHFILMNDLDFSEYTYAEPEKGWQPIGHSTNDENSSYKGTRFTGNFHGKGFTISHLRINRPTQHFLGLFGNNKGNIDSLGIEEIRIYTSLFENFSVGGLAGAHDFGGGNGISNCYVTGHIEGGIDVGGLVGRNADSIANCYFAGTVIGDYSVGGLVGSNNNLSADIENCYATGLAIGLNQQGDISLPVVGGLVGFNNNGGEIINSYAANRVEGGRRSGGLVGFNSSAISTNSYWWRTENSGQTVGFIDIDGIGTIEIRGLTTAGMHAKDSFEIFSSWDFYDETNNPDGAWDPPTAGQHFPQLRTVSKNAQVLVSLPIPRQTASDIGTTFSLEYEVLPPTLTDRDGNAINAVFESANPDIATISATGELTTKQIGTNRLFITRAGNADYAPMSVERILEIIPFAGGFGTQADPWQVATPSQLDSIRDRRDRNSTNLLDDHFVLVNDLDFAGYPYADAEKGWLPIGHDTDETSNGHQGPPFTGSFNGQGHAIWNLRINREEESHVGMFGLIKKQGAVPIIDSLGLEALDVTGHNNVGGLAGSVVNSHIRRSYAVGEVEGNNDVGGLAGSITKSGGTGVNDIALNAYAVVSVSGKDNVGGLIGSITDGGGGVIKNCYAAGPVSGRTNVGGLLGIHMDFPYLSQIGGVATQSYWNEETSGQSTSANTNAKLSTMEMFVESNFESWNFTNVWLSPVEDVHFPLLKGVGNGREGIWQYVSIASDEASFTEAEEATFTLTRTGVTLLPLSVEVSVTEQGTFLDDSSTPSSAMFEANATTAPVAVPLEDDALDEEAGSVTVTIEEGEGYALIDDAKTATTSVTDDDPFEVSIAADATSVTEGETATFTLTRTTPSGTLTVNVTMTEQGDYLGTTSFTADFTDGSLTASLEVPIPEDEIDEEDGSITATIASGTGYTIGDPNAATINVMDNDLPTITIAGGPSITEGTRAVFMLTRTTSSGILTVNVMVGQAGEYISGRAPTTVNFADESATTMLRILTVQDETDEPDGVITATVIAGTEYVVGDPASAQIDITDDDEATLPEVSIAAVTSTAIEGTDVEFTLTRTITTGELTVNVEVIQAGDYATNANDIGSQTIDFAEGEGTATLTIATTDDDTDEPNGVITATLQPSTDYSLGTASAEVGVADNDGEADPEVSIAAVAVTVIEGADAEFTLTRTTTARALTVNVEVTQAGDYATNANDLGSQTIDFAQGKGTATLTIATTNDADDEADGSITATLGQGTGYSVSTTSPSAQVDITDDDEATIPEVSIAAVTATVIEGADAEFTLTRTVTTGLLTVNVEVTQAGDYATNANDIGSQTVDFTDGEGTIALIIATTDDDTDEPNGVVTATLQPSTNYSVGTASAEVGVTDNDGEADPEVSIAAVTATVEEGTDAEFTLTRTTTKRALTVNVEVTQAGDYATNANDIGSQTIDFAQGEGTATLTIATTDDTEEKADGSITATLSQGTGYSLSTTSPSAKVDITDNENDPVGISDESKVVIYPNPIKGQLYVRLPQGGQVSIHALSGRQERAYRVQPKQEPVSLDVSGLSSGIYVVTLTEAGGRSTHYRVVKE